MPFMVTVVALSTSQCPNALLGPGPGGELIIFGVILKTTIMGGIPDGGGVVGVVGGVDVAAVTVTVTCCVALPALLLAVNV